MSKKKKSKKEKRRTNTILLVFIILAIVSTIIFNLPEKERDSLSEEKCNVSEGYEWNEEVEKCVVYCQPEDREADVCYALYDPVCGFKSDGGKETFSNDCKACSNSEVRFYVPGECENESKE